MSREKLIERIVEQIKSDLDNGDVESLEELISFIPLENQLGYLSEDEWNNFGIDLFEVPSLLPKEVQDIIENSNMDEQSYESCQNVLNKLNEVGYTCEYYLDGIPFNLKKL